MNNEMEKTLNIDELTAKVKQGKMSPGEINEAVEELDFDNGHLVTLGRHSLLKATDLKVVVSDRRSFELLACICGNTAVPIQIPYVFCHGLLTILSVIFVVFDRYGKVKCLFVILVSAFRIQTAARGNRCGI